MANDAGIQFATNPNTLWQSGHEGIAWRLEWEEDDVVESGIGVRWLSRFGGSHAQSWNGNRGSGPPTDCGGGGICRDLRCESIPGPNPGRTRKKARSESYSGRYASGPVSSALPGAQPLNRR